MRLPQHTVDVGERSLVFHALPGHLRPREIEAGMSRTTRTAIAVDPADAIVQPAQGITMLNAIVSGVWTPLRAKSTATELVGQPCASWPPTRIATTAAAKNGVFWASTVATGDVPSALIDDGSTMHG